jgi:hypothetical protein
MSELTQWTRLPEEVQERALDLYVKVVGRGSTPEFHKDLWDLILKFHPSANHVERFTDGIFVHSRKEPRL